MGYCTVCSAAVLFRTQSHLPEPAGERTGEGSFHGADACSERGRRGRRRRHGLRCRAGRRSIELETSGMPPNTIQLDCRRTAFLTWKTGWLETNCFLDLENMLAADELLAHMVRAASCLQMNGISTSKRQKQFVWTQPVSFNGSAGCVETTCNMIVKTVRQTESGACI